MFTRISTDPSRDLEHWLFVSAPPGEGQGVGIASSPFVLKFARLREPLKGVPVTGRYRGKRRRCGR